MLENYTPHPDDVEAYESWFRQQTEKEQLIKAHELPVEEMTDTEQAFAVELFSKRGFDDGGPISSLLNVRLDRFLGHFCAPGTKTIFMRSEHSPRLISMIRPDGTEAYIGDDWDQVPSDIKPKIAFFIRDRVPQILESIVEAGPDAQQLLTNLKQDSK